MNRMLMLTAYLLSDSGWLACVETAIAALETRRDVQSGDSN